MFKIIQKLALAPPTGLHSHVAPLTTFSIIYENCATTKINIF